MGDKFVLNKIKPVEIKIDNCDKVEFDTKKGNEVRK